MNSKLISIIVPVYNREDCIVKCIESALSQLSTQSELIVVNDGSTDHTLDVIKPFEDALSLLKIISYKTNRGVNYARNKGIESSNGQFILFLDSDDILTPNVIVLMEKMIIQHPDIKHFLFAVNDNVANLPEEPYIYTYRDWLCGTINGDFAHLVERDAFLTNRFDETFRIYESLNWLRIKKQNQKQLFIPTIAMNRDRTRNDSVSKEYFLQNKASMLQEYNFYLKFFDYYGTDMLDYGQVQQLEKDLKKTILIGIAINNIDSNQALLDLLKKTDPISAKRLRMINYSLFSPFIYQAIKVRSKMKH